MDKVSRQVYIDKELADKIQKFADEENVSFNKALQILLYKVDFKEVKDNWF